MSPRNGRDGTSLAISTITRSLADERRSFFSMLKPFTLKETTFLSGATVKERKRVWLSTFSCGVSLQKTPRINEKNFWPPLYQTLWNRAAIKCTSVKKSDFSSVQKRLKWYALEFYSYRVPSQSGIGSCSLMSLSMPIELPPITFMLVL